MAKSNSGTCLLCKQDVQHRSVVKHLSVCLKKTLSGGTSGKEKVFLIKIFAGKLFWLFVEINGSASLEDLDFFLRTIWLECCGHMSQFTINGARYSSDREMRKTIHRILNTDEEFDYIYDFGSTTELKGKVISIRAGRVVKGVRLIARNNLPEEIKCITCQKHPDVICSICGELCCTKCAKKHDSCEGKEFLLPVVNSPRMGVCGYTGQD